MNRGAVVWVDLSDASRPEVGKRRPAVIVSNTVQNQVLETLVAVPLSSLAPEIHPLRLRLSVPALKRPSYAIVPGIRQVQKSDLGERAGRGCAPPPAHLFARVVHDDGQARVAAVSQGDAVQRP